MHLCEKAKRLNKRYWEPDAIRFFVARVNERSAVRKKGRETGNKLSGPTETDYL